MLQKTGKRRVAVHFLSFTYLIFMDGKLILIFDFM
jgi:hypothetical protein